MRDYIVNHLFADGGCLIVSQLTEIFSLVLELVSKIKYLFVTFFCS